jgi:hypothetical protein
MVSWCCHPQLPLAIFAGDYSLTVDAITKECPSRNKVSLAMDGWISRNKLVITLVIAYCMD